MGILIGGLNNRTHQHRLTPLILNPGLTLDPRAKKNIDAFFSKIVRLVQLIQLMTIKT